MEITKIKFLTLALLLTFGCGQKSHDHEGHQHTDEAVETTGNRVLYDEVMKVHDEVMPKLEDIFKLKEELKKELTTNLPEEKKKEIETALVKLDSANQTMMDWMHNFNPPADSLGEENAREYLETEMEKVKRVRENIHEAIEEGKAIQ